MSSWTHSMCARCWNDERPDKVFPPERDGAGQVERCCFCGYVHATGIYFRESPDSARLACRARLPGHAHRDDDEKEDG